MRGYQRAELGLALLLAGAAALVACSDTQPVGVGPATLTPVHRSRVLQAFNCTASITAHSLKCTPDQGGGNGRAIIIGGQGTYLQLTSSNLAFIAGTDTVQADVTVQNLMNEAIGTPDGTVADPQGIQVFFHSGPTATGPGTVTVANPDGTGLFTSANQPYFTYSQILAKNQVSNAKTWKFLVPAGVNGFTFQLFIETDVQYLLVINEVMVNPPGSPTAELPLEWFELYNAGTLPVQLQDLLIADSSASGRQPYHKISSPLVITSGGYAVLGRSANTTDNGGVPVDYAYGSAINLANSLDALKVARLYGSGLTDTLTLDRTQYSSPSVSAKEGITRELKNPTLDNSNMDGSNWGDAAVTSVYGAGGRGTPKAQNSDYTP